MPAGLPVAIALLLGALFGRLPLWRRGGGGWPIGWRRSAEQKRNRDGQSGRHRAILSGARLRRDE